MTETYTYIARSAEAPLKVATFTLNGDSLSIGMGPPAEQIASLMDDQQDGRPWMKPMGLTLIGDGDEPIALSDVSAQRSDTDLAVQVWLRAGGLRLAPVNLSWKRVDNQAAADDFVRELHERKQQARSARRLPGILDYWLSWVAAGLSALIVGIRWLRKK